MAPHVLLVEDEFLVRELTKSALEDFGYHVKTANDASEALAAIDADEGIEILFTDIRMPGMDGIALADEAVRRRPGLKVLYATGYAQQLARSSNGPLHGTVMLKPWRLSDLKQQLDRLSVPFAS